MWPHEDWESIECGSMRTGRVQHTQMHTGFRVLTEHLPVMLSDLEKDLSYFR